MRDGAPGVRVPTSAAGFPEEAAGDHDVLDARGPVQVLGDIGGGQMPAQRVVVTQRDRAHRSHAGGHATQRGARGELLGVRGGRAVRGARVHPLAPSRT